VDISVADASAASVPKLIARVQNLLVKVQTPAKGSSSTSGTGTIVMGGDVKLSPVSVIHGSLSIQVATTYAVSQPVAPRSKEAAGGETVVVPQTTLNVNDAPPVIRFG